MQLIGLSKDGTLGAVHLPVGGWRQVLHRLLQQTRRRLRDVAEYVRAHGRACAGQRQGKAVLLDRAEQGQGGAGVQPSQVVKRPKDRAHPRPRPRTIPKTTASP